MSGILQDCWGYMQSLEYCRVRHTRREANNVADRLAHFASRGHELGRIVTEAPDFIQDVLTGDLCNQVSHPSIGSMSPRIDDTNNNNIVSPGPAH